MVKRVYDHNVVLKSKHEAFLAKIPMSPSLSHSPSPDPMSKSMLLSHSVSESNLPDPLKTRARKVSIAVADISLLTDQNAELLSKLQKLEEDATSADIAGRRELKRLEKEIVYLRDALEKTQAKSEELEGKVQNAVTSEAVRRKKEREAMRNAVRSNKTEDTVLDFAPPGSKFGGPSEHYPLLGQPKEEIHIRNGFESSPTYDADYLGEDVASGQFLISRLLDKVKELEEANARILSQQVETANQLANVQQDTLNMTKVYELLSDHDAVQLELEPDEDAKLPTGVEKSEVPTIRFKSLRRNMEGSILQNGSFVFPGTTKSRKTVLGLFAEQEGSVARDETGADNAERSMYRHPSGESSSSSTSSLTGTLSPLPIFSPIPQSDHSPGRSLQNELESTFGNGSWHMSGPNHMHTASLSNLSLLSAPSTPSPAPGSLSYMPSEEMDVRTPTTAGSDSGLQTPRHTPERFMENGHRLSVEPSPNPGLNVADKHASRLQNMSRTLRSRKNRWIERMSSDENSQQANHNILLKPRRRVPGFSHQVSKTVDGTKDNYHALSSNIIDDPEGGNNIDDRHTESPSQITTPRAQRGELGDEDVQATIVYTRAENNSFLFKAWLWFQFAVVVLFFIFSMARKGPSSVLAGSEGARKERRAVAGR